MFNINIIFCNIRSYSHNFIDFFNVLQVRNNETFFDIIFLNECWLKNAIIIHKIPLYYHIPINSCTNQNSGLVIYVKNTLKIKAYKDLSIKNIFDGIELKIETPNHDYIYIQHIYRYNFSREPTDTP